MVQNTFLFFFPLFSFFPCSQLITVLETLGYQSGNEFLSPQLGFPSQCLYRFREFIFYSYFTNQTQQDTPVKESGLSTVLLNMTGTT